MDNERTRVTERIGFAEHFGSLSPLALSNETLRSEIAANDAHVYEARHSLLLFCGDIEHRSRTDGKSRRNSGLASLAFHVERNSWGLRGERASEKPLCAGVSMCHEVCLRQPKRVIRIVCERLSGRRWRRREGHTSPGENLVPPECSSVVQMLHESIMAPKAHAVNHAPLDILIVFIA
jgi:hypothetical protein